MKCFSLLAQNLRIFFFLAGLAQVWSPAQAFAMDFILTRELGAEIARHAFPDIVAIQASGEIVEGDAAKLKALMPAAQRDQFGNVRIYLDSPGGNVAEAQKLVQLMDEYEVTAVVKNDAKCLSACASVLFLSARIHLMMPTAVLGFHTCRIGSAIPSPACNELLNKDLVYRGTDFGAASSFFKAGIAADVDMYFMDWRLATFWGLLGPPTYDPTIAIPSIDCKSKQSALLRIICDDLRLSRYEASYYKSFMELAKSRRLGEQTAQKEYSSNLSAILARCGSSAECQLREIASGRKSARMQIIKIRLDQAVAKIRNPQSRKIALSFYDRCGRPAECGRPDLLDATFEFAQGNFAVLLALLSAAEERGESALEGYGDPVIGTSDCVFPALCDTRIRTMNWVLLSEVAEKKISPDEIHMHVEQRLEALGPQELQ